MRSMVRAAVLICVVLCTVYYVLRTRHCMMSEPVPLMRQLTCIPIRLFIVTVELANEPHQSCNNKTPYMPCHAV
jgi:hypothetical protein